MTPPAPPTTKVWLSRLAASKKLGITPHRVLTHAAAGRIATRCLPGQAAEYSAADVEKLKAELEK